MKKGNSLGKNLEEFWSKESNATELWDALDFLRKDSREGLKKLELLSANGSVLSDYYIGELYFTGYPDVSRSFEKAAYWFRRSFLAGFVDAGYSLAKCLQYMDEPKSALPILENLAEQNYPPAFYLLGLFHFHGLSVPKSRVLAIHYFSKGHKEGHIHSSHWLSDMYLRHSTGMKNKLRGISIRTILLPSFWYYHTFRPHHDRYKA